ncbi:hypothetical protein BCR33DRAFT_790007 [Rhizoclosmatium globosum]|uniref:Uncharacterized protein n=1 Tax=Rhizoclosmatium globosum TaxID=329046 RepID=A0A1Y2BQ18_9FUNG|nr:hypothetical protein BCR33DRAFT_790007 [Rhizoclosmatium globosum]|eukprot:ORY36843.1 hypothetical protein BCR33DRAFT_790007 [Rhizoclosmatium globosum]
MLSGASTHPMLYQTYLLSQIDKPAKKLNGTSTSLPAVEVQQAAMEVKTTEALKILDDVRQENALQTQKPQMLDLVSYILKKQAPNAVSDVGIVANISIDSKLPSTRATQPLAINTVDDGGIGIPANVSIDHIKWVKFRAHFHSMSLQLIKQACCLNLKVYQQKDKPWKGVMCQYFTEKGYLILEYFPRGFLEEHFRPASQKLSGKVTNGIWRVYQERF